MHFDNVTYVRDNLENVKQGLKIAEDKLQEKMIENVRFTKKISAIRNTVETLEENFLHKKSKRAVGMIIAIGALAGLGMTNLGLHTDLRNTVNTLQQKVTKIEVLEGTIEDIQDSLNDLMENIEFLGKETS